MSEFFGKKYRVNPETSRLLQEVVFEAGGKWGSYGKAVRLVEKPFLFVDMSGDLTWCGSAGADYFNLQSDPEGHLEVVTTVKLAEPKETVELGGKTYYKKDLEKALENIKPLEGE